MTLSGCCSVTVGGVPWPQMARQWKGCPISRCNEINVILCTRHKVSSWHKVQAKGGNTIWLLVTPTQIGLNLIILIMQLYKPISRSCAERTTKPCFYFKSCILFQACAWLWNRLIGYACRTESTSSTGRTFLSFAYLNNDVLWNWRNDPHTFWTV